MPKLSVKAVLLTQGKKENDLATISIRVSYQGLSRYKETGYAVPVKMWDSENEIVKKEFSNHRMANSAIVKQRAEIEKYLLYLKDNGNFTIRSIERYLQQGKSQHRKSFSKFVSDYAAEQSARDKKQDGTTINYVKHLNKLHAYAGKENIYFSEIDADFLGRYETWLRTKDKKPNAPNTVWDSVTKFFKKFFRAARVDLPEYDWPQPTGTSKEYLTLHELDAIEKLLPELTGAEYTDALYFLLECYSAIRHSDWTRYTTEKLIDGTNFKVRAKKNGEPVYLSLKNRPRLKVILKKCSQHPYVYTLESTNRNLKIIAAKAGITKKISTHVARHTFAVLHAEMGYSVEFVAECLGISVKAAAYYYKVTRRKLAEEEKRLGKGL
jgi:site-specific recombinase XerD